ncbi:murein hydrolase activator EnvC family protein [Sphingomicrobium marinum]|uniref:murein hydrolase activator EnvC family protein n=1 Tax=Sphingomicrobium marinum TaxID=1227950 RepID=UPI00223FA951|nr:peptidoglycan DD-metalloendopeptidase family protein [Sphingomicrobium marinum]
MRYWWLALFALLIGAAGAQDVSQRLSSAQAEARAAEKRAAALRAQADAASDSAAAFAARRAALAEEIAADELRLTEETLRLEQIRARLAAHEAAFEAEKAPIARLLAGLATMARQPPLLALADSGSVDELVRVQMLIDASLPEIERRSAAIEADAAKTRALADEAEKQQAAIADRRERRDAARAQFAEQEAEARANAQALADAAFSAERQSLAVAENFAELGQTAQSRAMTRVQARALAQYDPAPPRPSSADPDRPRGPKNYRMPSDAAVSEGFATLREGGIRSRGLTLATRRGAALVAPAAGTVTFSGPFRGYDGVLIIDHGDGWASLLTGVTSPLEAGNKIGAGAAIGRARGEVTLELWQSGTPRSAAIIAGSSK